MKKIWEKYKEIFIILLYVIVVACLFRFAIQPLFEKIAEKRNYAEEKATDQEITQKKIRELPQLRDKMEIVKQEEEKLNVFFKQENALSLIQRIENLAVETGNKVIIEITEENSNSGKDAAKKAGKEKGSIVDDLPGKDFLTMKLSLEGDFNSAMKFVHRIENMDYFSDIISLKISKGSVGGEATTQRVPAIFQRVNVQETGREVAIGESEERYENPLEVVMEVVFYIEKSE